MIMSKVFNTKTGSILLGNVTFSAGMRLEELLESGVVIDRVLDMKTGWVFRTTGPYDIADRKVYVSLEFLRNSLKRVGFSFCDGPPLKPEARFPEHTEFLERELGQPDRRTSEDVIYDFAWGTISSGLDLRGSSAQVLCAWNAP